MAVAVAVAVAVVCMRAGRRVGVARRSSVRMSVAMPVAVPGGMAVVVIVVVAGHRQGWLMMPARVAQASAPFVFGLALDGWGRGALWLSGGLGLVAFAALMAIRLRHDPAPPHAQPPAR